MFKRLPSIMWIAIAFVILLLGNVSSARAQPVTWFVSEHVDGGNGSGVDWDNASPTLTGVLNNVNLEPGDIILVGQGTYKPVNASPWDQDISFFIDANLNGIQILGGFAGWDPVTGELAADPDANNPYVFLTILTGDLDDDDSDFTADPDNWFDSTRDDNSFTVIRFRDVSAVGPPTRLDGFIIEGARSKGALDDDPHIGGSGDPEFVGTRGGGIHIFNSNVVITRCTIRFNSAGDPNDSPSYAGVSGLGGGAAAMGATSGTGRAGFTRFINCIFHDNVASTGGAVAVLERLDDQNDDPTQVELVNCLLHDNRALANADLEPAPIEGGAGGIFITTEANVKVVNCTLSQNTYEQFGGGGMLIFQVDDGFETTVLNSIFWDNDSSEIVHDDEVSFPSTLSVSHSTIEGGLTGSTNVTVEEILDDDPQFLSPGSNDFRLPDDSPAINQGDLNSFTSQSATSLIPFDEFDLDDDSLTDTEPTPDLALANRIQVSPDHGVYELRCAEDISPADEGDIGDGAVNVTDLLARWRRGGMSARRLCPRRSRRPAWRSMTASTGP